jgi:biotin transporter BioY
MHSDGYIVLFWFYCITGLVAYPLNSGGAVPRFVRWTYGFFFPIHSLVIAFLAEELRNLPKWANPAAIVAVVILILIILCSGS